MSGIRFFDVNDFRIPPDSPLVKYFNLQPGSYYATWQPSSETLSLKKHLARKGITLNITLDQLMIILMLVKSNRDKFSSEELKILESIKRKGTKTINDYQSHHIIPIGVCKKSKLVVEAIKFGFDENAPPNRLYLPVTFHNGSHPGYSNFVEDLLEEEWAYLVTDNMENNREVIMNKIYEIIAHFKNELREKSLEGMCTINQIF
ncbi:hypothetical protein AM228_09665 [Planktothricoides sp. SR001]|uniref:AHH domain-containing protein n=1 Tax=Planktothricoides sp. SR001 TaxID=1705388 RepID=UPI0006C1DDE2|nr:AHH domain-containing protein [Planktothricoides sp. SR001]KOR37039.1 hypothetical protein AM228_09665 [Planktothricoides sp. SR001]